ncbi:MAG TPA: hypothetical protein VHN14_00820 [Kofleriaceae bacterium]|nr:hypothetical protein [Kofleriaceae bacterium]
MESLAFLEALIRALGHGWSARYGMIAPYGVFGVILTSDAGGSVEVVPSLVRGDIVTWSPFPFARGTPHYDLYTDEGELVRTPVLADAIARLERWRKARGSIGRSAARVARAQATRSPRSVPTGVNAPRAAAPVTRAAIETLGDALRDQGLGQTDRARKLARQYDRGQAAHALLAIARRAGGDARANALDVLAAVGRPEDGPELARYLADPEHSVQHVAIDGVRRLGYAAAVPVLATLVLGRDARPNSGRSRLAVEAAAAMKALSGKRGAAALTGYLTSADPRIREAACVAFTLSGNHAPKQARPLLERLLTDGDARVARAARRALAAR